MQGPGGNHSMDQARKDMQEKIFQLCQRTQPSNVRRPRLHDVVRRLDEMLYKNASSKEEYMNIKTLEHRVHTLLKQPSSTSHRQPVSHIMSSSSSISAMIPTPGMSHSGGTNSMIPSNDQARKDMQEKIFQLCQRTQPSNVWRPRLHDVVRRLDKMLYKHASSKEEYMNIETLEHRVHTLLKRPSSTSHRQPVSHIMSSSSSISTMIPTPGLSHSGGTNSMIPSSVDNSTTSSSVVTQNTVNTGHLSANGTGGGVHGSSFNASDGAVSNGFQQSSADIDTWEHRVQTLLLRDLS